VKSENTKWLLRPYKKVDDSVYMMLLSGHKGNVQTVAFARAGLLVSEIVAL